MQRQLRIQGRHYKRLKDHLFPGDGKEAVAVLLCGRHETKHTSILLSHQIILIPYEECERDEQYVKWTTERVIPFFEQVEKHNFAIVKIHSHPTGYPKFSNVDDESDGLFFPAAFNWSETENIHASLVMVPDGKIFGRIFKYDMSIEPLDKISVAGDDILVWENTTETITKDLFAQRTIQAFGEGTYSKLKNFKIGMIGCSGTGSPTIEQLVRLGVGTIVLVDPDSIEDKNLNRIINANKKDVGKAKVAVLAEAINKMGLGTIVIAFDKNLYDSKEMLVELISCDLLIGGVYSVEGRHLISQLTNFYVMPYFDLGVRLIADGEGGISTIVGSVHYIQPGMSSLFSRDLYNMERLTGEGLKRTDPEAYKDQVKRKYIDGVDVDRPAVISINMLISSIAIMEFLNRVHSFKDERSETYARMMIDYCGSSIENRAEDSFEIDEQAAKWAGRGDYRPFLRMPGL